MSGSPPQIETIGALHSSAAARQSSRLIMSLSEVEYSRIRPQPVQVRLHVCNGSSCKTRANFSTFFILLVMMWRAIFALRANGNLIRYFSFELLVSLQLIAPALAGALLCGKFSA